MFRQRVKKTNNSKTTYYFGRDYEVTLSTNQQGRQVRHMKHHIFSGNELVATHEKTLINSEKQADTTAYMHRDALGSVDTVTNEGGQIVQQQRYTPFGEDIAVIGSKNKYSKADLRGFTSHENVGETGLINMNARLYDPVIGRFIQADTVIPDPDNVQSYNRYVYVYNNPMKYTDPDGHFPFLLGLGLFLFSMTTDDPFLQKVSSLAGMTIMGGALGSSNTLFSAMQNGATLGFISGTAQGGLREGLKQGAIGGLSAGLTKGVADQVGHGFTPESVVSQMLVGGVIAEIRGGKFAHGAVSSLAGKVGGNISERYFGRAGTGTQNDLIGRSAVAMMFGGLAAKASGGSFEEGATRALFVHLFNDERRSFFHVKTRIGAVLELNVGLKKQAEAGFSLSPGYKEWDLSNDTSYPAGKVTGTLSLLEAGGTIGLERKNTIKWSKYEEPEDIFIFSIGAIAGVQIEFEYGRFRDNVIYNLTEAWNNSPIVPLEWEISK